MGKTQERELKRILKIVGLCILLGLIIGFIIGLVADPPTPETICYDMKSLDGTLEKIDENCGSTFITKQYGIEDWFVFTSDDCKGEYCKTSYINIGDCLE